MTMQNSYWAKRKAQFMVKQMGRAEDTAQLMNQGYYLAQKRLEEEAEKIFQRFQRSYGLTEQEARDLIYRAGTNVDAVKRELKNMNTNADILAEMNSGAYAHRIEALHNSSAEIDRLIEKLAKRDKRLVTSHLKRTAEDAYLHSIYLTQQQAGVGFNFRQFDEQVVENLLKVNWSKKHFSQAIWDNAQDLGNTLKEEFMVNYLTGRSVDDMAKQISSRMNVSYFNARRLVRTESTFVEAEMEARGYEACHIEEYEYVSVLDNRTSSLCQQHDGKIYKVKDRQAGVNYPPLHVFCRSTTIAHIPDEYLKEATNQEYQKLKNMSFEKWKEENVRPDLIEAQTHNESSLRNKNRKTIVTKEVLNSPTLKRKVDKIGEKKKITRLIYQGIKDMLKHRSGTEFEDLLFINSETGESQLRRDYDVIRTVQPNKKMIKMVTNHPYQIIGIHNHPNSSPPSVADLMVAYTRKYKYGIVAGHNGAIFIYQADKPIDKSMYNYFLDKYNNNKYNNVKEFIDDVGRLGIFMEVL